MALRVMYCLVATAFLLSNSLYSEESRSSDTRTIYIDVVGEGKFEVIYHRALSNATGAVIAGLIGAGIQSGVESGKDAEKTAELSPLVNKENWKVQFLDTLNDKLESEGFEAIWVEDARKIDNALVLKIYPENYGFKMVNTTTRVVSAYIDFKASLSTESSEDSDEWDRESFYLTSRNQYAYEQLLGENSPVNPDLEAVLEKAALRLANKIIYALKE